MPLAPANPLLSPHSSPHESPPLAQLDVQIGTLHLVDQIEWDLSSPLTPELFAAVLVRDLALPSSAAPLIAHALHSEIFRHKKHCLELGLILGGGGSGGAAEDRLQQRGPQELQGVWREWADVPGFGPRLEVLSLDEMDKVEADRERAIRSVSRDARSGLEEKLTQRALDPAGVPSGIASRAGQEGVGGELGCGGGNGQAGAFHLSRPHHRAPPLLLVDTVNKPRAARHRTMRCPPILTPSSFRGIRLAVGILISPNAAARVLQVAICESGTAGCAPGLASPLSSASLTK